MQPYARAIRTLAAALVILAVPSCASADNDSEAMYKQASALTKVTGAMAVEARRATAPQEDQSSLPGKLGPLLQRGTAHDPGMLAALSDRTLRVRLDPPHAMVLVCDAEGRTALIEDASCTAAADRHHWRDDAGRACGFTLGAEACR